MTPALIEHQERIQRRARRLMAIADKAQTLGVDYSCQRALVSTTQFRRMDDFLEATERLNRAAHHRFSRARRLRNRALDLLIGVAVR